MNTGTACSLDGSGGIQPISSSLSRSSRLSLVTLVFLLRAARTKASCPSPTLEKLGLNVVLSEAQTGVSRQVGSGVPRAY